MDWKIHEIIFTIILELPTMCIEDLISMSLVAQGTLRKMAGFLSADSQGS
jgi:hypothetical protein